MRAVLNIFAAAALVLLAGAARAQDAAAPRLDAELSGTAAVPGQAVSLRLTVLVPTFMPKPPVWPSFEAPNLWVRVASTGPTSRSIGGTTWSGVTRRYMLSPMVPGRIALPAAAITVTWTDPAANAPLTATLKTDPIILTGTVPEGAEDLDPFIAAEGLELTQTIEGTPDAMTPGASASRTVVARIRGTSPMFLPPLLTAGAVPGVRFYPDEPVLEETSARGTISGTRTERVTLLAEGGGEGEAPAVTLRWYDLRKKAVETASVEGFAVHVDGPPAARAEPRDWRAVVLPAVAALAAAAILLLVLRRAIPPARRAVARWRAARLASEGRAYRDLQRAVARRDETALRPALERWSERLAATGYRPSSPGTDGTGDPRDDTTVHAALETIGRARYGRRGQTDPAGAPPDVDGAWRTLSAALASVRHDRRTRQAAAALPPLNPRFP